MTFYHSDQQYLDHIPDAALYGGILFTAMSVLVLQVAFVRVFAILLWHHFAYLVVSLALLGFGASGSLLTIWKTTVNSRKQTVNALTCCSCLYALTIVLAFGIVTRIHVNCFEIWSDPHNILRLFFIFLCLSAPFLMAGLIIGTCITRFSQRISKVYFVDLVGSAVGAMATPILLLYLGATNTIVTTSALAALGGGLFSIRTNWRMRSAVLMVFAISIGIMIAVSGGGFIFPSVSWDIPFSPNKMAPKVFPGGRSEKILHSPIAQIDISAPMYFPPIMGGDFGTTHRRLVRGRLVTQDGTAPTLLYENAGRIEQFPFLGGGQAGSSYVAFNAGGKRNPDVLVIGPGGGIDVMMALFFDAGSVTAVEINSAMIRMVTQEYADYIGHLFSHPKVRVVHDDGRSYVQRTDRTYDIIQLCGVDTFTALSTGAYTLSENYLYTVEAIKHMYAVLNEGGYIHYSRFLINHPLKPRETIRLVNIARTALHEMGVQEPWRQMVVLKAQNWASTMIRKGPFTHEEVLALQRFSEMQDFSGLIFDPFSSRGGPYSPAGERRGLINDLSRMYVSSGSGVEIEALLEKTFNEISHGKPRQSDDARSESMPPNDLSSREQPKTTEEWKRLQAVESYRGEINSFMKAQSYFDVLLRGPDPVRNEFIAAYDYTLAPSTDDRPFFFNYFKLKNLAKDFRVVPDKDWQFSEYLPQLPVGHMVLLSALLLITVIAFFLIVFPLLFLRRGNAYPILKLPTFVYFASIGTGFMFFEISMMQKCILFLGHPVYSMSVVLGGILAFSGIGALISSRLTHSKKATFIRLSVIIGMLALFNGFAMDSLLTPLFKFALDIRILWVLLLLAPTAIALGMPFPLGIRMVKENAPELIPWAWAINGFFSVFSSIMAIVLAMTFGFSGVLVTAGVVYIIGMSTALVVLKQRVP